MIAELPLPGREIVDADKSRIGRMIARLLILIALAGIPPLTPDQQAELAVDDPAEQLEGPGLRPLLEHVLAWDTTDAAYSLLPNPDYDALLADPTTGRGEAFLIEGQFAGRTRRFMLDQRGPWGKALTEWVLIVRDEPQQVAVVYFVDPDNSLQPPYSGEKVRVPARFYKVWTDTDQEGQPTDYLTFVARAPLSSSASSTQSRLGSAMPLLLGVLLLALIYVGVLRFSRSTRRPAQAGPVTVKSADDAMLSDLPEQALPDDPAEALQRLADRPHDS